MSRIRRDCRRLYGKMGFYLFLLSANHSPAKGEEANPDTPEVSLQLRKCCGETQYLDGGTYDCIERDVDPMMGFLPPKVLDVRGGGLKALPIESVNVEVSEGMPDCSKRANKLMWLNMSQPNTYFVSTNSTFISLAGVFETTFPINDFCLEVMRTGNNTFERGAVVCDPCADRPCFRTCCPHLQIGHYEETVDGEQFSCRIQTDLPLEDFLDPPSFFPEQLAELERHKDYAFVYRGKLKKCPVNRLTASGVVATAQTGTFSLDKDGNIISNETLTPNDTYCLAFLNKSEDGTQFLQEILQYCPVDDRSRSQIVAYTYAYPICCMISNMFLLATLVVYILLPELREPLFGKIIMAFICSLFLGYFFLSISSFSNLNLANDRAEGEEYNTFCRFLGFCLQFTFLLLFFWMNVLAFDIYQKFRRIRTKSTKEEDKKKLLAYTAYAMGCPTVILLITITFEYLPEGIDVLRPEMGYKSCFISTKLASFLYFYLHLIIIQILNVIFFTLTIVKLSETWKATKNLQSSTTKNKPRENFFVILKLFFIMGVTWIAELIAFLMQWIHGPSYFEGNAWAYFVFVDALNLLQGVFIFYVLVCKKTVLDKLKARLHWNRAESVQSQRTTRSSTLEDEGSVSAPEALPERGRISATNGVANEAFQMTEVKTKKNSGK